LAGNAAPSTVLARYRPLPNLPFREAVSWGIGWKRSCCRRTGLVDTRFPISIIAVAPLVSGHRREETPPRLLPAKLRRPALFLRLEPRGENFASRQIAHARARRNHSCVSGFLSLCLQLCFLKAPAACTYSTYEWISHFQSPDARAPSGSRPPRYRMVEPSQNLFCASVHQHLIHRELNKCNLLTAGLSIRRLGSFLAR
jgi:hypothetical protein